MFFSEIWPTGASTVPSQFSRCMEIGRLIGVTGESGSVNWEFQ